MVRGPIRVAEVVGRIDEVPGSTQSAVVEATLRGAPRHAIRCRRNGLPETGDDLRARAPIDRFPHRRARLLALADVRDGVPIELAAEAAGVVPDTLYFWLRRGATHGLEAALDRQRGDLNQAQAIEIAQWIAEAPTDQLRWSSDRVKNEVFRRFGLEISREGAARLLRKHGPWPRRRVIAPHRGAHAKSRIHD